MFRASTPRIKAPRARYKCIIAGGFQQFNDMDALDEATDLMVPREKKCVAVVPREKSTRVRKAISRD